MSLATALRTMGVLAALACCNPAFAQSPAPGQASGQIRHRTYRAPPRVPALRPRTNRPVGHLFGLPVVVNAPVAQPYAPSAYRNFGGQPEQSGDDLTAGFSGPRSP
jgi:hypothetical protein